MKEKRTSSKNPTFEMHIHNDLQEVILKKLDFACGFRNFRRITVGFGLLNSSCYYYCREWLSYQI